MTPTDDMLAGATGVIGGRQDYAQQVSDLDDIWYFQIYQDLLRSIIAALEARDPHTAEHSLRVGEMVERTCRLMGVSRDDLAVVCMAANVHDIGKVGIPDSILLKRARRTPEEHQVLHDHARIGAEILSSSAALAPIASIVRHHHERWDGSGYPDGLVGVDIPWGSRILAVCDSIDAMLGKRSASKCLTKEECRHQIVEGAGVLYDPVIASFIGENWAQIVEPVTFRDSENFDVEDPMLGRSVQHTAPLPGDFSDSGL